MKKLFIVIISLVASAGLLAQEPQSNAGILSTVGEDVLDNSSQRQILNAMYGLLPGLQLYQNGSGYWPADIIPNLTVRGKGSYSGNHPLILIDGVVRDPSEINVAEVESVTVIKDAASLAKWGVRGADGALMITTRRGGQEPFRLKTSVRTGLQIPYGIPKMASPGAYARALNEALANDGLPPYYSQANVASIEDGTGRIIPTMDWQSAMLSKYGLITDADFSIDGSRNRTRYYVYANYSSNSGFLRNTGLTENINTQAKYYALKIRSNLDIQLTRTTTLLVGLSARLQQQQGPNAGLDLTPMYTAPTVGIPARFAGMWVRTNMIDNPIGSILGTGRKIDFGRSLLADITICQDLSMIIPGLKADVHASYDNSATIIDSKSFTYSYLTLTPQYNTSGDLVDYSLAQYGNDTEIAFSTYLLSQNMRFTTWGRLYWDAKFGKNSLGASMLASREYYKLRGVGNTYKHYDFVFAVNYDYDRKYLLNLTLNESASSLLSTGDKFRFYPAASVGWVLSKESFMSGASWLDYLKLRASAGLSGMDANLQYDMDKQFNGVGNSYIFTLPSDLTGLREGDLPSVGVRPETELKIDAGIDFKLASSLTGEIDVFMSRRDGLRTLAGNAVSGVLGVGLSDSFEGRVSRRGVEAALQWNKSFGEFSLNLGGNLSYVKNRIDYIEEQYSPASFQYQAGGALDRVFALMSDGFYSAGDFNADGSLREGVVSSTFGQVKPGDVKYKDLYEDGKIDNYDYTWMEVPTLPNLYYGARLGFAFRGLALNVLLQGTGSWTAVTNLPSVFCPLYGGDKNVSDYYLANCWHPDVTDGVKYPRLTTLENNNNFRDSDVWTANGRYLKLRELQISYTIKAKFFERINLKEAKVFLQGNNLFSIDDMGIFDPEYISTGYPCARTYMAGINIQF